MTSAIEFTFSNSYYQKEYNSILEALLSREDLIIENLPKRCDNLFNLGYASLQNEKKIDEILKLLEDPRFKIAKAAAVCY